MMFLFSKATQGIEQLEGTDTQNDFVGLGKRCLSPFVDVFCHQVSERIDCLYAKVGTWPWLNGFNFWGLHI